MYLAIVSSVVFPANDRRGELKINKINGCIIESSIHSFSDSAEITIAKNTTQFIKLAISEAIQPNDEVIIELGYNQDKIQEFEGVVTAVSDDVPVVISCRDKLFEVMQTQIGLNRKNITLQKLLRDIIPNEFEIDALDVNLGKVRIDKNNVGFILKHLRDKYGLTTYLRGNTVMSGKLLSNDSKKVSYGFERNIKPNNQLEYRFAEATKLKIEATSTLQNGDKIVVSVGDEGGSINKVKFFNITSKKDLEIIANKFLEIKKFTGFTGSFSSFGIPFMKSGWIASIESKLYPERNGDYLIEKVTTIMDDSPKIERTINIGMKI